MRTAFEAHRACDLDGVLRVVDRVYAAGAAEASWERALAELCRVGGFGGGALTSVDPLAPRVMLRASYGLNERVAPGAGPGRIPRNPLLTDEVLRSSAGAVWHDRRIDVTARLATTLFWTRWMQPQGFVSWACVILGKAASQVDCVEVYDRPRGASGGPDAVNLLTQLAPHLARAWRLSRRPRACAPPGAAPAVAGSPPDGPPAAPPATSAAAELGGMAAMVRLRTAFGLSKAEARLALHLAAGASLASMAQAFDVKLTTIRSQLQQVFSKTGTSRQPELVALLLSHGYVEPIEAGPESVGRHHRQRVAAL